jgi:hypothetical protein
MLNELRRRVDSVLACTGKKVDDGRSAKVFDEPYVSRGGSRATARVVTRAGFVAIRLATSTNVTARSYSPASTASLIASSSASSLVVGACAPWSTGPTSCSGEPPAGSRASVRSALFAVMFRDESSRSSEKQAGARSTHWVPDRDATSRNPSVCASTQSPSKPRVAGSSPVGREIG